MKFMETVFFKIIKCPLLTIINKRKGLNFYDNCVLKKYRE